FEDEGRVSACEARAAVRFVDVDAAEPQFTGLTENVDGKVLRLVPLDRVRGEPRLREVTHGLDDGALIIGESRHGHPFALDQCSWSINKILGRATKYLLPPSRGCKTRLMEITHLDHAKPFSEEKFA